MHAYSHREAIIFRNETVTYHALLERYVQWKRLLTEEGVQPGQVAALVGTYSPSLCGAFLALLDNGNTIVPMSPEGDVRQKEQLRIAHVEVVFTLDGRSCQTVHLQQGARPPMLQKLADSGRPGMILFTSGTTGEPKAIVHDMIKFTERYKTPRDTLRTLSFLRFDHIGGMNTLLHTLANGGSVVCPDKLLPGDICALIEHYKIELLPTSPSFLNLLLVTEVYQQYDLSSLKLITYGTEVMPEYTLQRLRRAFPGVQFRQTYGLSEVGILRAKSMSSDSLLFKVGGEGVEVKVRDGILYIRSQTAMEGYLNAPDPFDEDGWLNTQDQVVQEGEFIRIIGRKSEIINVGGQKVYPAEVEEVLLQMPEVRDVTVRGEPNVLLGNIVTATVNLEMDIHTAELKQRIKEFCADKLEGYQIPVKIYMEQSELYSDRFKKIRS
ncbi:ANL family adenylate-forming protein [Paenibacillus hexagrammi]|uniref:AMP-binding protein n=1 Tax=Paenibacillus hexagrammi TaxID=2908839 RepID=A0ABY3SFC8_9BACL|nr:fatty acid--CoA ligase family protein [Paenibacillus sp. YPD9-1]UJF31866.1 AMP-binding protein [Paenibacillus sp. YPD9-1]